MAQSPADRSLERLLERVHTAFAAHLEASDSLSCERLGLAERSRAEMRDVAGIAGHLVHYDFGVDHPLVRLLEVVTDGARREALERDHVTAWLPGDLVNFVDNRWSRPCVVRFIGDDGTVDVQPDLREDYIVETVPSESLRSAQVSGSP